MTGERVVTPERAVQLMRLGLAPKNMFVTGDLYNIFEGGPGIDRTPDGMTVRGFFDCPDVKAVGEGLRTGRGCHITRPPKNILRLWEDWEDWKDGADTLPNGLMPPKWRLAKIVDLRLSEVGEDLLIQNLDNLEEISAFGVGGLCYVVGCPSLERITVDRVEGDMIVRDCPRLADIETTVGGRIYAIRCHEVRGFMRSTVLSTRDLDFFSKRGHPPPGCKDGIVDLRTAALNAQQGWENLTPLPSGPPPRRRWPFRAHF